ncbi:MAG: NUDIX hydrolase [Solirubrobacterales bacterium]|nr:NUDIX hydrolase [Solirubrobacterales bacterium]
MRTDSNDAEPEIVAAGGVVIRRGDDGRTTLAVIHRPKYMDWSLPKGKLEKGEGWQEAALREVKEETGFDAEAGHELSPVSYRDRKGRSKLVRYWLMSPLEGKFKPGPEVDELRWVDAGEAEELLSYDHDRELVREALGGGWRRWMKRVFGGQDP